MDLLHESPGASSWVRDLQDAEPYTLASEQLTSPERVIEPVPASADTGLRALHGVDLETMDAGIERLAEFQPG
jgi:hypothetical protein